MRKIFTFFAVIILATTLWAQSPEKMSYQAVIRNSDNQLIVNKQVGMKISIQKYMLGLPPTYQNVYIETQTPTSNENGLISIQIGGGTIVGGTFSSIDWGNGTYYINTEIDPAGGTNYSITGKSQILSVPYALSAKSVESIETDLSLSGEGSTANPLKLAQQSATQDQVLMWNGTEWKPGVVSTLGTGNLSVSQLNFHKFKTDVSSPYLITPEELGLTNAADIRRILILMLEVGWNSSAGPEDPAEYRSLRSGIYYEIIVPPASNLGIRVHFPETIEYCLQYGRIVYLLL